MKDELVNVKNTVPDIPKKKRRQVWISQEVFEYIANRSIPLVDTADDVLRRLFDIPPKSKQ